MCVVFFASYFSNKCNTPDLTISIKLVMGVRGGTAVVSVFCSFNTGLLSVQHTDSLQCVSVCILSFPHILSTLHVLTGFFSLGSLIVAGDSKLLLLSTFRSTLFWMLSVLRTYLNFFSEKPGDNKQCKFVMSYQQGEKNHRHQFIILLCWNCTSDRIAWRNKTKPFSTPVEVVSHDDNICKPVWKLWRNL